MQPCDSCHACSFPDKVAQAKASLPAQWVAELTEEEAPDHIWLTAGNLYADMVAQGGVPPESFLQMLSGGEMTDEDRAWAERSLADIGVPTTH
ncbi:hypothetical protein RU820_05585 [Acidithiobacillus ferrooxidans]|uniref:Uncharacterized protein n=1 Tax=Acidithiobacillus ferrooxidans (strain ATCC 23270 / DSM 14882 / CIP 104768 / NCIMB 8455) TaxID=243159 RepID=B7J8A5_ACIF2|nr:hypothetical protein [Acidithiobacillus ferrooxidans]ACK79407.1 hypothetical protein AFE_1174 [Acidithiobacillus ferrooxidans ATCC 23270]